MELADEVARLDERRQAAVAGGLSDAATITLPVYTPATAEAFATYGSIAGDSAVELPLEVPDDAIPAFGGLEVTTSSTALQELTDAFLYLVRYRFQSAEPIASRLLAVAALRDVLTELVAEGLSNPEVARALVVSRSTVESHLKATYRKLDVSSREELAEALGESSPRVKDANHRAAGRGLAP